MAHPERLILTVSLLLLMIVLLILLLRSCAGSSNEPVVQETQQAVQTIDPAVVSQESGTIRSVNSTDLSSMPGQLAGYMAAMMATNPENYPQIPGQYQEAVQSDSINPADYQFIVAIDAGHGGSDAGWESGAVEKEINLIMAEKVQKYINQTAPEYYAFLTRSSDATIGDQQRLNLVTQGYADLVISLHCNGSEEELGGVTAAYWTGEGDDAERAQDSKDLAQKLMEAAADGFGMWYREIRIDETEPILKTSIPSVMLEMGYLTYGLDQELVQDEELQDEAAKAIGDVIIEYMKDAAPEKAEKQGESSDSAAQTSSAAEE